MEVLQNNMVVAILGKGDLVGYDIPLSLVPESLVKSSSEVKALTYCDLKSIHIAGLLEVLRMYPEFAETFCTEIVHDLTFNLREGYQMDPDTMLHGAHSLILPSISEDDEEEDEDDDHDGDHDDDSGSGSPPSSPSTGGGRPIAAVPSSAMVPSRRRTTFDHWDHRRKNGTEPIIQGQHRKPALKFCTKNISQTSKSSSERTRSKESHDAVDSSRIDRIDSQLNSLSCEMSKITSDMRLIMDFMRQMCGNNQSVDCSENGTTTTATTISSSKVATNTSTSEECRLVITDPSSPKCSSLTSTSSCSQLLAPIQIKVGSSNKYCQTERSLLDDLLTKMTDSGSPPPNSGYSSSSSNEEKVKYLIHCQNRNAGIEGDTESISDDSVLRPSNSLTIQSMASSRDVSPFKGSRTSFNNQLSGDITGSISPSPSPRPATITAVASVATTTGTTTTTSHATCQTSNVQLGPLLLKTSSFSHQSHFQPHKQTSNQQSIVEEFPPNLQSQKECTIDIESHGNEPQLTGTSKDSIQDTRGKQQQRSMVQLQPATATTSSNPGSNQRNLSTEL